MKELYSKIDFWKDTKTWKDTEHISSLVRTQMNITFINSFHFIYDNIVDDLRLINRKILNLTNKESGDNV